LQLRKQKQGKPSPHIDFLKSVVVLKMDPEKDYREAYEKAKLIWKKENIRYFDPIQEGEGVLTRRQAAAAQEEPTINRDQFETDNVDMSQIPSNNEDEPSTSTKEKNVETTSNLKSGQEKELDENEEKNQEDVADDLFNKDTLIAENDLVKAYVIKTFLKRQIKFNTQDHQYVLHLKKKTDKPILFTHVLDILEKCFFAVLQNLKTFYKDEPQNMVYFTLTQGDSFNEFRTSPYVIQDNHAKDMVDHLMSNFNRFVNSNSSMQLLEQKFAVYFRVISKIHLDNSSVQRKPISLSKTVGTNSINCFLPGGRISLKTIIKSDCLPKSICFAFLKLTNTEKYNKVKTICYKRKSKMVKKEGLLILNELEEEICKNCKINLIGPHDIKIVESIAIYLQVQIHIILSMEGPKPDIQSFPAGNNYELPRIYLQVSNDHINIIDNLIAFFAFYKKMVCFDCRKILNNTWRKTHRCPHIKNCFNCNGIYQTEKTIFVPNENVYFCNSNLSNQLNNEMFNCNNCNLSFLTNECFLRHKKMCDSNAKGWKCLDCGIFEFSHTYESKEILKSNHVCGIKKYRCCYCYQIKEENHICKITKQEGHLVWPNMAFLHVAFKDFGCANCTKCYELRKTYCNIHNLTLPQLFQNPIYSDLICDIHKNNTISEEPNVISFFKEENRFIFQEYIFYDDNLYLPENVVCDTIQNQYCENAKPFSKEPFKHKKSPQKVSIDFANILESKFNKNCKKTAVDKFMLFLCQLNFMSNFTVVVSDSRILLLILKSFVALNIIPNVFQDGNKVNFLEIPSLKIRFVHINCYLKGSIYTLASQFNIEFKKIFYPKKWNKPEFYNYVGNSPDLNDFYDFSDTKEDQEDKKTYHSNLTNPYNFNTNLINTTRYESKLFFTCCLCFLKQCFELQDLVHNFAQNKNDKLEVIHPFGWKISSLSGFTYAVFAYFFMNDEQMFSVMQPFTGSTVQSSRGEFEWTSWLNWKNCGLNILNAFNNPEGQKSFGKHFVDGYSFNSKTVYQYRGCEFHFHLPPECSHYQNKDRTIESCNGFGIPLKTLKEKDEKERNNLLTYYSFDVKNIETIYECEWFKFKSNNALEMETFRISTNFQKNRPLMRLTPRATLRGGFIEVYRLKFCINENPNWKLYFSDVNSLYSQIALTNLFPVGKYKVILNPDSLKNNIKYINNHFFYNNEPMQGDAAHVKVLPPSNLYRPYLPFRLNDEYNHMSLCRACLTQKLTKRCIHKTNENRAFVSCYQVTDLEKAVSLGYVILEWYELHHYSERKPIFEIFVKILASQKLKNTNLFSENDDPNEICKNINIAMNFDNNLTLDPLSIKSNPAQKQLYKEMLNSFYGRFALHTNFTKHIFCRSLYEIEKYGANPDNHILDIIPLTDDVCEIEIITPTKIKPSLCGTLYLTSEINALARKFIYEKTEEIEKLNGIILSIDTDSILFALPPNVPDPLIYSHAFGDFKNVLEKNSVIESFYSFGPRNYSLTYKDSNGVYQHLLKVKGLSTQSANNCDVITPELYKAFIDKSFHSEICNIYLPQLRKVVDKQTKKFHEILTYFNFGNDIHAKRFIFENDYNYITYPYGYKFN